MTDEISNWLTGHYAELAGTILGLIYITLSVRQKVLTWPFGIATSLVYAWVFYTTRFYAGMGLQLYYVAISIYGWIYWVSGKSKTSAGELPVTRINRPVAVYGILLAAGSFILLYFLLTNKTDSPVPFMDALTTALSIAATWLLARKVLENWLVWIVTDLLCIGLYASQNLWATVVLFAVYEALAIYGYFQWKSSSEVKV
ncbi:MAG TPA: nicotinamide riboside transporter PnuC [Prolixibacteraceae bacterium]|nr:nicotinamide riboside transporter PnuC [Prolixibacteraceae bacterium]